MTQRKKIPIRIPDIHNNLGYRLTERYRKAVNVKVKRTYSLSVIILLFLLGFVSGWLLSDFVNCGLLSCL